MTKLIRPVLFKVAPLALPMSLEMTICGKCTAMVLGNYGLLTLLRLLDSSCYLLLQLQL